ncbi:MAG: PilN domain-containing protein [Planctomycetota bacterium]
MLNRSQGEHAGGGSFLPEEYVKSKGQSRANIVGLALFGVVLIAVVGVFVLNHQRQVTLSEEVKMIRVEFEAEASKIEQLRVLEKRREELLGSAEVVAALIEPVPRSVLMAELLRDLPGGLALSSVVVDAERIKAPKPSATPATAATVQTRSIASGQRAAGDTAPTERVLPPRFKYTLTADGLAELNNEVADYLASLKGSPLFRNVELVFISETKVDDQKLRKFRITAEVRRDAEATAVAGVIEADLRDAGEEEDQTQFTEVETGEG